MISRQFCPDWPYLESWLHGADPKGLAADMMEVEVDSIIHEVVYLRHRIDVMGLRNKTLARDRALLNRAANALIAALDNGEDIESSLAALRERVQS